MLIESDWNNLECVLWHSYSGILEHWWRNQSDPSLPWSRTATITNKATGPGCLIQSSPIASNDHGDFQVVVPEGNNLVFYWRDNSNGSDKLWYEGPAISSKATGAGSMIQSSYGTPNNPANFEVVVPEGNNLVHYSRDNSQPNTPWSGPTIIMNNAAGSAALIQSTYGIPEHPGNFEVVVPTKKGPSSALEHYFRDNSNMQWSFGATVMSAYGPVYDPSLIQSQYDRKPPNPANFELIIIAPDLGLPSLIHLFRDNSSSKMPWAKTATIIDICQGPNALIESNYGEGGYPGNFEVITVPESSYQHFYRDNGAQGLPWYPGATITGADDENAKGLTQRASEAQVKRKLSPLPRTGEVRTPPIALK